MPTKHAEIPILRYYGLCFAGLLIIYFVAFFLDHDGITRVGITENSMVEIASAGFYFLIPVLLLIMGGLEYTKKHFYYPLLAVLLGFRELDFNARFTDMGITKSRFYISEHIEILPKIIGFIVLLLFAICVFLIIFRHSKAFFKGLKLRDHVATGSFIIIAMLLFSRVVDGLEGNLNKQGITVSTWASERIELFEEVLELGIPIMMLLAFWYYFNSQRKTS